MIIRNGLIYSSDCTFHKGDIAFENDTIVSVLSDVAASSAADSEVIDAEGLYVIPGLIDIHLHGANGADFSDGTPEAFRTVADFELSRGVTTILPTGMTLPETELQIACRTVANYPDCCGAHVAGFRLEGPFLSRAKCGAQNPDHLSVPDKEMFLRLFEASDGKIKIVDIAPELEGASGFIRSFSKTVRISLAHTDADYDTCKNAFSEGACHVTHLYNGMRPCLHREPGLPGAAADSESVMVETICDGIHLHPATVRNALRLYGTDRVVFISDSMRACGLADGNYTLGGQDVTVKGPYATLGNGTLAGSVTDLMNCLKTAVKHMGIPLETALRCCTANPAKALGIGGVTGSLVSGKKADIVLLDKELTPVRIFRSGEEIRN